MEKISSLLIKALENKQQEEMASNLSPFWESIYEKADKLDKPFNFLNIRTKHFAEQTTIYEHNLYSQLNAYEFVGQNWGSKGDHLRASNILNYTKHMTNVTSWYANQILDLESPKSRAALIETLIYTMVICFQLNNFVGTFEILFALNSTEIFRLSKTWWLIPEEKRRIVFIFTRYTSDMFTHYKSDFQTVSFYYFYILLGSWWNLENI